MRTQKVKYKVGDWCLADILDLSKFKDGYINTEQILILSKIQKLTNPKYNKYEFKEIYFRELVLSGNIKMLIIGATEKEVYINGWDN